LGPIRRVLKGIQPRKDALQSPLQRQVSRHYRDVGAPPRALAEGPRLLPRCYPGDVYDFVAVEIDEFVRKVVARDRIELSTLRFSATKNLKFAAIR
jgi:hypothetical protein